MLSSRGNYVPVEVAGVYEVRLMAFNGNGASVATQRLVSLSDTQPQPKATGNTPTQRLVSLTDTQSHPRTMCKTPTQLSLFS